MTSAPRVAFVIDSLPSLGGGEKVLFTALESYPHADIFTLVYNSPLFINTPLAERGIKTSWLNDLPFAKWCVSVMRWRTVCQSTTVLAMSRTLIHPCVMPGRIST
jgi:hypothetical protein